MASNVIVEVGGGAEKQGDKTLFVYKYVLLVVVTVLYEYFKANLAAL